MTKEVKYTKAGKTWGRQKGSITPWKWISGPDFDKHEYYRPFTQQRNQAKWRNEEWDMTFDEWYEMYGEYISQRGRKQGQCYMVRLDPELPWHITNCEIWWHGERHPLEVMKNEKRNRIYNKNNNSKH